VYEVEGTRRMRDDEPGFHHEQTPGGFQGTLEVFLTWLEDRKQGLVTDEVELNEMRSVNVVAIFFSR
jgi:hypothetical protein